MSEEYEEERCVSTWAHRQGKYKPYRELKNHEMPLMAAIGYEDDDIIICVCPYCQGTLGVDPTYVDQVSDIVHCPMCCTEMQIPDPLEEVSNGL